VFVLALEMKIVGVKFYRLREIWGKEIESEREVRERKRRFGRFHVEISSRRKIWMGYA
jgi:hypothetical protein